MTMTFEFGGVQLCGGDFSRDVRGWVAFSIALASATGCRDKEAALELLYHEADQIIAAVREGKVPS